MARIYFRRISEIADWMIGCKAWLSVAQFSLKNAFVLSSEIRDKMKKLSKENLILMKIEYWVFNHCCSTPEILGIKSNNILKLLKRFKLCTVRILKYE